MDVRNLLQASPNYLIDVAITTQPSLYCDTLYLALRAQQMARMVTVKVSTSGQFTKI